ncbi:hypothetical protein N7676_14050 [Stenotrophomonas sp. GD03993]|uniref:hypothetical protein n=1 Tax=unclassified Stenotrophomonas TaxID=196198 RepID=UPI001310781A|nr:MULTISPECIES: hypothetical protein [unclassified Stenotrophomonas]MBH1461372.1 hypothetical protein [Stenotrophomonas maltophilia]MDH0187984.1 hypothetical protein [Stenotrophomonas sp. GD04051]MDH0464922.1 hypothetical protein [Stenotrophomonas sp. GD03993]MDH0874982.1 hypothetical protein [Stenotrophomonas sp. GD03877]MDH2155843.1 hypothetical protein [Stenotrophomonas sp. GD03657]
MSILNVLLTRDHLVVAVDTLAEDALTGAHSADAKLLLIPQHNLVFATRGSTQFFLRIYELALQATFRVDFTMEQLSAELGLVVDQLLPNYEKAVAEAGLPIEQLGTELVLGGWSPKHERMMATAYAKSDSRRPCVVQPIGGQLASPGEPLHAVAPSMAQTDLLAHARLQASHLNEQMGRKVAGGRLLAGFLQKGQAVLKDLGEI